MKSFLILLLFSVHAFADNRDWCGDHKQVTFKPQTFKVVTEDGFVFPQMVHKSRAGALEAIWNGEDWFSADEFHETKTTVTFDQDTNVYTVAEFKIKPKSRWKVLPGCKDIVETLSFEANWGKREEGVNIKYHRSMFRVSIGAKEGKVVVPSNPDPHLVVLKKRDIVEGKVLSTDGHAWELESNDGRKIRVLSGSMERPEEYRNLKSAYENSKAVRLYGKITVDSEGTIRLFFDYVDVL